ncbi:MAG: hypothetical protein ABSH32_07670 [Bryobacteraceae bacterium]|jgi:predicted enzyme related to lactoylglutathione lyase
MRLRGFELYFEDLEPAKRFYRDTLGVELTSEQAGHHAQFGASPFLSLECKGAESYPSRDKAVVFVEVPNLQAAVDRLANLSCSSNWARQAVPHGLCCATLRGTTYS